MTVFSADFASVAAERAKRIDLLRLVADHAADLPGYIVTVTPAPDGVEVQIFDVDPSDVSDVLGPPESVTRYEGSDQWRWLHPAGFTVILVERLGAA